MGTRCGICLIAPLIGATSLDRLCHRVRHAVVDGEVENVKCIPVNVGHYRVGGIGRPGH